MQRMCLASGMRTDASVKAVCTKQGITGRAQGAKLEKTKRSSGDIRESIPAVQMERKSVMLAGFRELCYGMLRTRTSV